MTQRSWQMQINNLKTWTKKIIGYKKVGIEQVEKTKVKLLFPKRFATDIPCKTAEDENILKEVMIL